MHGNKILKTADEGWTVHFRCGGTAIISSKMEFPIGVSLEFCSLQNYTASPAVRYGLEGVFGCEEYTTDRPPHPFDIVEVSYNVKWHRSGSMRRDSIKEPADVA